MAYKRTRSHKSRLRQHAENHTRVMSVLAVILFLAIISISGMTHGTDSPTGRLLQHLTALWHHAAVAPPEG